MAIAKTTRMDAQGRVILPPHIRKAMNLKPGTGVDVDLAEDGTIRIRPAEERCVICGENPGRDTHKVKVGPHTKHVCSNCAFIIKYGYRAGELSEEGEE